MSNTCCITSLCLHTSRSYVLQIVSDVNLLTVSNSMSQVCLIHIALAIYVPLSIEITIYLLQSVCCLHFGICSDIVMSNAFLSSYASTYKIAVILVRSNQWIFYLSRLHTMIGVGVNESIHQLCISFNIHLSYMNSMATICFKRQGISYYLSSYVPGWFF